MDDDPVRHHVAEHVADHYRNRADLMRWYGTVQAQPGIPASALSNGDGTYLSGQDLAQLHRLKIATLLHLHDLLHARAMRTEFQHIHLPGGTVTHIIDEHP